MFKRFFICLILIFSLPVQKAVYCQSVDTTSTGINSRLSFYSFEKNGEFLLLLKDNLVHKNLSVILIYKSDTIATWNGRPGKNIVRIPFIINLPPSVYRVEAIINVTFERGITYVAKTDLIILHYKKNEVKTDRLNGGLIVNKRQFFPFGFYCYSPVYSTLPEEEVVKGFNMISPYQKIDPETLSERKAYMDRSAQLGMKVHYNLLSVSGGGGVGSKIEGISEEEKKVRLINEIKTFMDHPALLGWYISDEPNGRNISPEQLEDIYRTVKETDPWHPVSIVFMVPYISSKKYMNALDIVMADPYPVPDYPVTMTGDVTGQLIKEFSGKRPVWIVPQAFGGGELWSREPTRQEIRSMTWQSIINGATGIQYFVRQGLSYFPKSAATWAECGQIATEVAELTPWLLSEEESPSVTCYSPGIIVSSRVHSGKLLVMAVNRINQPVNTVIRINKQITGKALLPFENRSLSVNGGIISDQISPLGSQVYLVDMKTEKKEASIQDLNLLKDGSFEDMSGTGIPSACYVRPGGDRGATFFLDTREHYDGNHSLRIVTPQSDKSLAIRFFPFTVKAGSSYTISIWAKSDPEQNAFSATKQENGRLNEKMEMPQYTEISLGDFSRARFVPDEQWRRYVTFVTIPSDTLASFKTNLILKMPGQGVAWFDQVRVTVDK